MTSSTSPYVNRGFTLIELVIAVAIVGILGSVAYPSYVEQVARGRRADAKAVLLEAAQYMERNFTEAGAYNKKSDGTAIATGATGLPTALRAAPKDGTTKYYDIALQAVSATTFTLRATRKTGVAQANDKCGNFEITNTGSKALNGNATGYDVDACWQR